jgi:tryptophan synthase alpha chain
VSGREAATAPEAGGPLAATGAPGATSATPLVEPAGPPARHAPGRLEAHLRARRAAGQKLLVPYVTGGLGTDWVEVVQAVAAAGADAIEIGIPFSDPVMDGVVIQEASQRALASGATPMGILSGLSRAGVGIPLAVMTYYNLVARAGEQRMAAELAAAGVSAAILPDLPLEECGAWCSEADAAGVETVLLAAPTSGEARLERIVERSRGFLYAVGLLGVTGERDELARSSIEIARRCKEVTDLPVLVGVGISTPAQAREVSEVADGVVVGSALVRRLLAGEGPEGAARFVGELRAALDK